MTTDNSVNERQLEPTNAMVRHVDNTLLIEIIHMKVTKSFSWKHLLPNLYTVFAERPILLCCCFSDQRTFTVWAKGFRPLL